MNSAVGSEVALIRSGARSRLTALLTVVLAT